MTPLPNRGAHLATADAQQRLATPDAQQRLAEIVAARTGLEPGHAQVGRRLAAITAAAPGEAVIATAVQLAAMPLEAPEWQLLLDQLLVPETYLFRHPNQLALMMEVGLAPRIASSPPNRTLRLWSAGCCTGEEAYSLAVLALQGLVSAGHARAAGGAVELHPAWTLDVLGTDISATVLDRARSGIYAAGQLSAFRNTPADHLDYFPPMTPGRPERRVRPDIGRHVRFVRAGLTEGEDPPAGQYDVVVCRNVLIYLTKAARQRALERLSAAVRPGGVLLLGPTDEPPDPALFSTVWGRDAVVHRRHGAPA